MKRRLQQANDRVASRKNVAHHYDLSNDFYRRWLDEDMQYSCAYFARPDMTLEEAQVAKKRHLAAKLRLEPGREGFTAQALVALAGDGECTLRGCLVTLEITAAAIQSIRRRKGLGGRSGRKVWRTRTRPSKAMGILSQ